MSLAVKFYSQVANPLNIPGVWPAESVDIGNGAAPDNTYTVMSFQEFLDYKAVHQAAYDAWYFSYMASLPINQAPIQPVELSTLPEGQPFANPTYRTKRNAIADIATVNPGSSTDIDFAITTERYVQGGEIVIENAEFGDWIEAAVEDPTGLIPSGYRALLCEAWPVVAKYIDKAYIPVQTPGSMQAGSITVFSIDTYPLNAKISAGLILCITYHAISSGSTRRVAVNYHLTKKL
jgi:hypothetical protein